MIIVGIDDTDNATSRGTGKLARSIAAMLAAHYPVAGVVRHQLLKDERIPFTAKNSSASILIKTNDAGQLDTIFKRVRDHMLADFQPGSDPGLCVAAVFPGALCDFGQRAKREVLTQPEARALAEAHGVRLRGLGGTEDGVIGALAAVGLAASGSDGRYIAVGESRSLRGALPVEAVLAAGIAAVQTREGKIVEAGTVYIQRLRPARRGGRPVALVKPYNDGWIPLKVD